MTEKVVLALMAKRAEIQGYIQDLETKARRWRTRLAHVDATLTIFSPETDPEAIQPKRRYRRSQYFRGGEFARLCLDVLREASGPITTAEVIAGADAGIQLPAIRPSPESLQLAGPPLSSGVKIMSGERVVFVEESGPDQYLKLVAAGQMDESLLEALEDFVKRQKKRLQTQTGA
jgi:hypothetical protein